MRRLLAPTLGLCLLTGAGCANKKPPTPAQQALAERREINKDIAESNARLIAPYDVRVQETKAVTHSFFGFLKAIANLPRSFYDKFTGNTPLKYAREMNDSDSPDIQRAGILKYVQYPFGRKPPYTTRYAEIARTPDEDYTVRAAAIRALNYARDHKATFIFIRYLDDKDFLVRLEATKALANLPDEKAIPALIRHLNDDDNKDVRIACADALRLYHTPETARILVAQLPSRDFSVAWQSRRSLIVMTGRDFRYSEAEWLKYFNESPKPFL